MTTVAGQMGFQFKFDTSGIEAHKKWMEYLISKEASDKYGQFFDTGSLAERLEGSAKAVVQKEVYDAYQGTEDSYDGQGIEARSMNLLNSITAVRQKLKSDAMGYAIYSDWQKPGVTTDYSPKGSAEAKLEDGISYAAYFLGDGETFIKQSGMPHRSFWIPLVRSIRMMVEFNSLQAMRSLLNESKPSARKK